MSVAGSNYPSSSRSSADSFQSAQQQEQQQEQQQDDNYLFQHLSFREALSRTYALFVDRLDVYLTLSAVVVVPAMGLGYLMSMFLDMEAAIQAHYDYFTETKEQESSSLREFVNSHSLGVTVLSLTHMTLEIFSTIVGEAGIIRAAADAHVVSVSDVSGGVSGGGSLLGWWMCLRVVTGHHFVSLLGASLLIYLPVYGGFFAVVVMLRNSKTVVQAIVSWMAFVVYSVVALIYLVNTRLVFPVIVVEDSRNPLRALQRSYELSRHRVAYIAAPLLVLWIVKVAVAQALHHLFRNFFSAHSQASLALAFLTPSGVWISFVPELMYLPLNSILKFVLYTSLRVDKEGFCRTLLQRELVLPLQRGPTTPAQLFFGTGEGEPTEYRQVSLLEDS